MKRRSEDYQRLFITYKKVVDPVVHPIAPAHQDHLCRGQDKEGQHGRVDIEQFKQKHSPVKTERKTTQAAS